MMRTKAWIFGLVFGMVLCLNMSCGSRIFELLNGNYVADQQDEINKTADAQQLSGLRFSIDRTKSEIVFEKSDQSKESVSFTSKPRAQWGMGCPTQTSSALMEILVLNKENLSLAGITFKKPALIATCGMEPPTTKVLLFEDPGEQKPDDSVHAECIKEDVRCLAFRPQK
jgi:hypothetical protein